MNNERMKQQHDRTYLNGCIFHIFIAFQK